MLFARILKTLQMLNVTCCIIVSKHSCLPVVSLFRPPSTFPSDYLQENYYNYVLTVIFYVLSSCEISVWLFTPPVKFNVIKLIFYQT